MMPWRAVAFGAALTASIPFYALFRSMEHFVWHFGYGCGAGLLAAAVAWRLGWGGRATWWLLGGYGYMVVPDVIWLTGLVLTGEPWPHRPWMDLFLGHYSLDRVGMLANALVVPFYVGALWLSWRTGQALPDHGGSPRRGAKDPALGDPHRA